jgi:hypothetical protein
MGLHGREDQSTNTTCLFAGKNTVAPRLPSKIPAKVAEPSTDAIYMHTPTKGRDSTAMSSATAVAAIYYLWSFPQHRGEMKPLKSESCPLLRSAIVPIKQKSPARKPGFFIAKGGSINRFRDAESMSFLGEFASGPKCRFRRWEKCWGEAK